MRLDKFLKISLIFKTRNSAEKLINNNKILVNDKTIKPAVKIRVGDIITVETLFKKTKYLVISISEKNVSKKEAKELTKVISEEKLEF
ncbi:MAG: RNA-binding S4 domain-containing protein [Spirochaetes bacterium]|nr:RNA-binding S4 domain-containing protein [Spirochaetota bacterium]